MDDKLDFEVKNKKSAKKGRRAGLGFFTLNTKDSGNQEENTDKDYLSPRLSEGKSGGWAAETSKSNGELNRNAVKDFDDGIPVIPNLEDNADDELIGKIARAPLIGVNKVASYKELENDLLKHTAFSNLEELNLRILTNNLYPESSLAEPDELWTKDSLLSEVISILNNEREKEITHQGLCK